MIYLILFVERCRVGRLVRLQRSLLWFKYLPVQTTIYMPNNLHKIQLFEEINKNLREKNKRNFKDDISLQIEHPSKTMYFSLKRHNNS